MSEELPGHFQEQIPLATSHNSPAAVLQCDHLSKGDPQDTSSKGWFDPLKPYSSTSRYLLQPGHSLSVQCLEVKFLCCSSSRMGDIKLTPARKS